MKKYWFLLLSFCGEMLWIHTTFAQVKYETWYYEKTAFIENNVKHNASGDGHFITFTQNSCYESDRNGFANSDNILNLVNSNASIIQYKGNSYYGPARYYFSSDKSRLNIKTSNGGNEKIYVYVRKNPPDKENSTQLRKPTESIGVIIPPSVPSEQNNDNFKLENTQMYLSQYNRFEENAKSIYNSLTITGVRITREDGSKTGYSDWYGSSYATMKSQLYQVQSSMRQLREEARRKGIIIPQSSYEYITIY